MSDELWNDNSVQFPRLIAEILANGVSDELCDALLESMDLDSDELAELFDRAQEAWEEIKARTVPIPGEDSSSVITRTWHGGVETLSYEEWATNVIQEGGVALEVAERMLAAPDEEYPWNDQQPEFYETFLITDLDGFKRAYERAKEAL